MSSNREEYRLLLEGRARALSDAAATNADSRATVTLDQQSVGRLSRMDALQQQAMARATDARRQAEMLAIEAALARLDDGSFGLCVECEEPIAPGRLALDPTVRTCLDCARG
ncbi:TraR/DksA family transcriptional regulator [Oceanomicrobium pacificus]|uniref:TraR/DksA family transcriptional regulator n=1 Tax=Oceanomicrobium pacificus TaxID=2692916 RepID=A0A6B0TP42_9RHOB|nr:TraR/DksA C4-type zinc finger protein [Oceanomicrobium pacificus]MXU66327.1 TraR/DksA family transcriptional regulator [Oceanomicrobium pacificus]